MYNLNSLFIQLDILCSTKINKRVHCCCIDNKTTILFIANAQMNSKRQNK